MPVKTLLKDIETSVEYHHYNRIRIQTTKRQYFCEPDDIAYASPYFFRIMTCTGEVLININNLESVELFGGEN